MLTLAPWLSVLLLVFFAVEALVIIAGTGYFIMDYLKSRGDDQALKRRLKELKDQDTGRYHGRIH